MLRISEKLAESSWRQAYTLASPKSRRFFSVARGGRASRATSPPAVVGARRAPPADRRSFPGAGPARPGFRLVEPCPGSPSGRLFDNLVNRAEQAAALAALLMESGLAPLTEHRLGMLQSPNQQRAPGPRMDAIAHAGDVVQDRGGREAEPRAADHRVADLEAIDPLAERDPLAGHLHAGHEG